MLFRFPTPVIELTSRIYNELEKVFDGKNASFNYNFTNSKFNEDWEQFRVDKLKEPKIWKKKGWKKMKNSINSFIVIDLPEKQTTPLPEPYFYWLAIENAIDFETEHGKVEWIVFNQEDKVACIDDQFYRTFEVNSKNEIVEGSLIEVKHNIIKNGEDICPVCFFWDDEISGEESHVKKSPLSPFLSKLDDLLKAMVSKDYLDGYASYPIYSVYASNCNYENEQNGDKCDGGFLRNSSGYFKLYRDGSVEKCPVCSNNKFVGPGTVIEIPIPNTNSLDPDNNVADLRKPVEITTIDIDSLNYITNEIERKKSEIYQSATGDGSDVQKKQAINLDQVNQIAENKNVILNNLKKNFEKAMHFVDEVCCIIRYGENYISSSINLGTEFYNYSITDLYSQYKQAKENGASESQLNALVNQIIETENKTNQVQLQRMKVLNQLEPYRNYAFTDLMTLKDKNLVDNLLLTIKLNFNTFVDRFERENTNILEFGIQLSFDAKIKAIFEQFKIYANEQTIDKGAVEQPVPTTKPIGIGAN